jgi:hypothetical protein
MSAFHRKKIAAIETVGETLGRHRKHLGLSIEHVSHAIAVSPNHLKNLEKDAYDHLPPAIYTKNFIYEYAKFLSLSPRTVYDRFLSEKNLYYATRRAPQEDTKANRNKLIVFLLGPKTLKYTGLICLFVIIAGYLLFSINNIFSRPELIISYPLENNMITNERTLELQGVTEREVTLTVNGRQVIYDKNGRFSIQIDLQKGLNIIKIEAKKKHSRENTVYKQIIAE